MKPIPAIVEPAALDIDLIAEQVIVAVADHKRINRSVERLEGQLEDARSSAKMRRIEIGKLLAKARGAWPNSGPNAKGWGEFLARVKLDDSTAHRYMQEYRDPNAFSQAREKPNAPSGDRDTKPANVHGGSGETARGTYCTPKKYADAIGPWDLDPFSNPRAHIAAKYTCMLENGGNGIADPAVPGSFRNGPEHLDYAIAGADTRVFLQPPYELVDEAIEHFGHTRFCALLRFAPDTGWFAAMWPHVHAVAIPFGERLPFEIDGVEADGAPFPHAFYYADERDVTDEIRKLCLVWRVEHETPNT